MITGVRRTAVLALVVAAAAAGLWSLARPPEDELPPRPQPQRSAGPPEPPPWVPKAERELELPPQGLVDLIVVAEECAAQGRCRRSRAEAEVEITFPDGLSDVLPSDAVGPLLQVALPIGVYRFRAVHRDGRASAPREVEIRAGANGLVDLVLPGAG